MTLRIAGICSFHPFFPRLHYPLIDIDGKPRQSTIIRDLHILSKELKCELTFTIEESPHGYHVYIWKPFPRRQAFNIIHDFPNADKSYAKIGWKRKHWFLRTTQVFNTPVPVTYMSIEGGNWLREKLDFDATHN